MIEPGLPAWIEPPTDPKNGNDRPRIGTLGLTGLCTDPDVPDAARTLADWSARHAGSLGLNDVRLPTTADRRVPDGLRAFATTTGAV
ncbi:MAG TPA: hypothetical protein VH352_25250 [Pseudonocardiaceae bacterium]|nr:hypothetical protein [Pseudonocardiaceae bacterium]